MARSRIALTVLLLLLLPMVHIVPGLIGRGCRGSCLCGLPLFVGEHDVGMHAHGRTRRDPGESVRIAQPAAGCI